MIFPLTIVGFPTFFEEWESYPKNWHNKVQLFFPQWTGKELACSKIILACIWQKWWHPDQKSKFDLSNFFTFFGVIFNSWSSIHHYTAFRPDFDLFHLLHRWLYKYTRSRKDQRMQMQVDFEWFARKIECTVWVGMILCIPVPIVALVEFPGKFHPLKFPVEAAQVVSSQDHGFRRTFLMRWIFWVLRSRLQRFQHQKTHVQKRHPAANHVSVQIIFADGLIFDFCLDGYSNKLKSYTCSYPLTSANGKLPHSRKLTYPTQRNRTSSCKPCDWRGRHGTLWVRNSVSHPPRFEQPKNLIALFM